MFGILMQMLLVAFIHSTYFSIGLVSAQEVLSTSFVLLSLQTISINELLGLTHVEPLFSCTTEDKNILNRN